MEHLNISARTRAAQKFLAEKFQPLVKVLLGDLYLIVCSLLQHIVERGKVVLLNPTNNCIVNHKAFSPSQCQATTKKA